MTICATVLAVQNGTLLVRDCRTRRPMLVRTNSTSCFQPGDRASIRTRCGDDSDDLLVTASHICRLCH